MKKSILIALAILFTSSLAFTQTQAKDRKVDRKVVQEKVKSLKVGYLTNALELTPEESQKFWPLYNQYEAEKTALLKEKPADQIDISSDADGSVFLARYFELRDKEISIEKKYADKFKSAINVKKVAKLYQVEKRFRQEIMSKIVEKRKEKSR